MSLQAGFSRCAVGIVKMDGSAEPIRIFGGQGLFGQRQQLIPLLDLSAAFGGGPQQPEPAMREAIQVAEALALVPGTSRSGVTISAGRLLGFDRREAAKFSFLLSVPVILLATVYEMGSLIVSTPVLARYKIGDLILALQPPYFRCTGRDRWWTPLHYAWNEFMTFNLGRL